MNLSKTQLHLRQLNDEIQMVVKSYVENCTSYFPNRDHLLNVFENYLQCVHIPQNLIAANRLGNRDITLFKEEISSNVIGKCGRFLTLILNWDFLFQIELDDIILSQDTNKNSCHCLLKSYSLVDIIFLMYLSLEIQRKQIIGKNLLQQPNKSCFYLKQIIKILGQFNFKSSNEIIQKQQVELCNPFLINQDRLVKLLLLKSLKIKIQRQKKEQQTIFEKGKQHKNQQKAYFTHKLSQSIPFNASIQQITEQLEQSENLLQSDKQLTHNDANKQNNMLRANNIERNISLMSVESQYFNDSNIFKENSTKVKQSIAILPLKLNPKSFGLEMEMENLTNDQIFKYISLGQFKDYLNDDK